jgi:hypothetical protein
MFTCKLNSTGANKWRKKELGPACCARESSLRNRCVKKQMRHTVQWLLMGASLLFASLACAASDITLISGGTLTITATAYNRTLPHGFYDQAMSSLPRLHPGHQLLASRRTGFLGEVVYALVCYRETPSSEHVVIQAVALFENRAWNLNAISPPSYGDTLVELLEHIGKLPSSPARADADKRAPRTER